MWPSKVFWGSHDVSKVEERGCLPEGNVLATAPVISGLPAGLMKPFVDSVGIIATKSDQLLVWDHFEIKLLHPEVYTGQ